MSLYNAIGAGLTGYFAKEANKKAAKALAAGGRQANRHVKQAYNDSLGFLDTALSGATETLNPYIEDGNRGRKLYNDAIGINGLEAQQSYHDLFENDPGFQDAADFGLDQIERSYGTRGGVNSGRAMIALADNARKDQYGAYQNRLNQLKGVGDQGFLASRGVADLQYNTGGNKASLRTGLGSQLAQNAIAGAGGQAQYHANNANIIGSSLSSLGYGLGNIDGANSVNGNDYYNPIDSIRSLGQLLPTMNSNKEKANPYTIWGNGLNNYF